jgi:hypothetical protein
MPKPPLKAPWDQLESDIIETLLAGHHEWRPDLDYPQSHSDMQGAVRGLLRMFEVKRRPLPVALPIRPCASGVELKTTASNGGYRIEATLVGEQAAEVVKEVERLLRG